MVYITGDTHAEFDRIFEFCYKNKTTKKDILIILGDVGINYHLNVMDNIIKDRLLDLPITLFCIHGNHEERPYNIDTYKTKKFKGGIVYYESDYPNILFADDGNIYNFEGKSVLVIGGAYSVDKNHRLMAGYNWFSSEQPTDEIKNKVRDVLYKNKNRVDIILSHTCPYKYMPRETFLTNIDNVDNSTEYFLDEIENNNDYISWYCGHFHIDKTVDRIRFMMYDIIEFK